MSFQKVKTISFCVGQKHYSGAKTINGEIVFNGKTGKEYKLLVGRFLNCYRKKSIFVKDKTIEVEGPGDFF